LLELAPLPIVLRDTNNWVLRANKEFTDLFGFTVDEAQGRNINDLIVPEELWEDAERLLETFKGEQRVEVELVRRRRDGKRLNTSFVAAPVSVPGGEPEIYGIYRDITDRKKAEEAQ